MSVLCSAQARRFPLTVPLGEKGAQRRAGTLVRKLRVRRVRGVAVFCEPQQLTSSHLWIGDRPSILARLPRQPALEAKVNTCGCMAGRSGDGFRQHVLARTPRCHLLQHAMDDIGFIHVLARANVGGARVFFVELEGIGIEPERGVQSR